MFKQSDAIRDYIFPIATAEKRANGGMVKDVLGTAFLIGNKGFALTAKHVVAASEDERIVALFTLPEDGWLAFDITAREPHPFEDVALVKLDGGPWKSFFRLSNSAENASCRYRLWGYPNDAFSAELLWRKGLRL